MRYRYARSPADVLEFGDREPAIDNTKLAFSLVAWLAGLILGALLVLLGSVVNSLLAVRAGLVLAAAGMAAGAATRFLAIQASGKLRWYTWISVGGRLLAAVVLIYFVATLRA